MTDLLTALLFWILGHKLTLAALVLAFIAGAAWEAWMEFSGHNGKSPQRAATR